MASKELKQTEHSKEQQAVNELILVYLSWLDSHTPGVAKRIPVSERQKIAEEAERDGIRHVANKYGYHSISVKRAVRDVTAAKAYHLNLSQVENPVLDVTGRVIKLMDIEQNVRGLVRLKATESMQPFLAETPHVRQLVDWFVRYQSLEGLLGPLGVSFTSDQERSVRRYLEASGPNVALHGMVSLALRFALAKWLVTGKSFSKTPGDQVLLDAVPELFSLDLHPLSKPQGEKIRQMRLFLRVMIQNDVANNNPRLKLQRRTNITNKEALSYFQEYVQNGTFPQTIRDFAQELIGEVPLSERAPFHSKPTQVRELGWAGMRFLENVLTKPESQKSITSDLFLKNTTEILNKAKDLKKR